MRQAEETIGRMETLARTTAQELAAASAGRDEFLREAARVEVQGRALSEQLRPTWSGCRSRRRRSRPSKRRRRWRAR